MESIAEPITADCFSALVSCTKANGQMIVQAHFDRFTALWTAYTEPYRPFSSLTYRVDSGALVTVRKVAGSYLGAIDGRDTTHGLAMRELAHSTHLRLVEARNTLPLSNPVIGTVSMPFATGSKVGGW